MRKLGLREVKWPAQGRAAQGPGLPARPAAEASCGWSCFLPRAGSGMVGLLFVRFSSWAQNPFSLPLVTWPQLPQGKPRWDCRLSWLAFLFPPGEGGLEPLALTRKVLAACGPPAPQEGGGGVHVVQPTTSAMALIRAAGRECKCKLSSGLPPEDPSFPIVPSPGTLI